MNVRRLKSLKTDQRGMVSILVTMVIMLIISLIVIGFATLSRREQRQSLDRQLSTQAFYAAESGINDAVEALRADPSLEKTSCGGQISASAGDGVLDAAAGVAYTCVLIDPSPTSLEYASIETDQATVIPLQPLSGALEQVRISWQDKTGLTDFGGCLAPSAGKYVFPAAASWPTSCSAGVLRIDLVPRDASLSRAGLMSRTLTAFLYPRAGSAAGSNYTYTIGSPDKGAIIPVNCNSGATPRTCNLTIQLSGTSGVSSYYLRARSIYRASSVNITGYIAGNQVVEMINAQAVVDSTGKANDVLRRIAVRVPLTNLGSNVPGFAIQTGDSLCKRFSIAPNISPSSDSGDPACQIN